MLNLYTHAVVYVPPTSFLFATDYADCHGLNKSPTVVGYGPAIFGNVIPDFLPVPGSLLAMRKQIGNL